jgi:hypothetical protein
MFDIIIDIVGIAISIASIIVTVMGIQQLKKCAAICGTLREVYALLLR